MVDEGVFIHVMDKPDACEHVWNGPEMPLGIDSASPDQRPLGWARTCSKCGMDAYTHSLRTSE